MDEGNNKYYEVKPGVFYSEKQIEFSLNHVLFVMLNSIISKLDESSTSKTKAFRDASRLTQPEIFQSLWKRAIAVCTEQYKATPKEKIPVGCRMHKYNPLRFLKKAKK